MIEGKKGKNRLASYVIMIFINFALLYVANNLLKWNISWLLPNFSSPLLFINISLGSIVFVNLLFIFYDPSWFRHIFLMILNVLAFLSTMVLLGAFPFALNLTWSLATRIGLAVALAGILVAFIVELYKLIFSRD
jgi:hypothetical protein